MGLDVYLYHCPNRQEAKAAEDAFEAYSEKLWSKHKEYKDFTKAEKKEIEDKKAAKATALQCTGEYNSYWNVEKIEMDSKVDSEHLFKVGYFRSSYNNGGINSVLGRMGVPDLYEIFGADQKYEFTPDWMESLANVNSAIEKYKSELSAGDFDVMEITGNIFVDNRPKSSKEARELFKAEFDKNRTESSFRSYSNSAGDFFLDGMTVLGFICGTRDFIRTPEPCTYIAVAKEKGGKDWYLAALQIVKETIEYVIAQPDPQNFYFHWSS